jgi:hypothetical protein
MVRINYGTWWRLEITEKQRTFYTMALDCGLLEYDSQIVTNNWSRPLDTTSTVTKIWKLLITLFVTNTRPDYKLVQILQMLMEQKFMRINIFNKTRRNVVQYVCRTTPKLYHYEKEPVQEMWIEALVKHHIRIARCISELGQKHTFYKTSKQLSLFS